MKKSATQKAAEASGHRFREIRAALVRRSAALLLTLLLVPIPAATRAESSCLGIHVKVLNINNSQGTVACALFNSPTGFPIEYLRAATNIMVIKIRAQQAQCDFEDIPKGTYALAVIHDKNMNGKLDTNFLGIPTEGYGFSNDAKGVIGAPSFSAASFQYDGRDLNLTISLHY